MFNRILMIMLLFNISFDQCHSENSCENWKAYKDEKCFDIYKSVVKTESEAEKICIDMSSKSVPAIISTESEQKFIEELLKKENIGDNDVWIALKKINGEFKWMDGTDFIYTNWEKDRPLKNSTDLNCVVISVDPVNLGKWIDVKCGKSSTVLCQKVQPWSLEKLQSILLEERRIKTDEINLLKQKLNEYQQNTESDIAHLKSNPVPIGFIYVQFWGQSGPKNLWPNIEWETISPKYGGLFFRAEGGQSSSFGQTQEQQTHSLILQSINVGKNWQPIGDGWWGGPMQITGAFQRPIYTGSTSNLDIFGIQIKNNNEEIRPRNQAIRIWIRSK